MKSDKKEAKETKEKAEKNRADAIAAAVGSLIILSTFSPAIAPASLVACRCASLKYAGTVITASVTARPK